MRNKKRFALNDFECIHESDTPSHRLDMRCYFGGSSSSKTATTQSSVVQNQQVGASEGAIAAGAGASISLEQVSDEIALAAFGEIGNVTGDAIKMAGETAKVSADTSKYALGESLGFAKDYTAQQLAAFREERKDNLDFLNRQTEVIASSAGVTTSTSALDQQKLMLIGFGILAVTGVVVIMVKGK